MSVQICYQMTLFCFAGYVNIEVECTELNWHKLSWITLLCTTREHWRRTNHHDTEHKLSSKESFWYSMNKEDERLSKEFPDTLYQLTFIKEIVLIRHDDKLLSKESFWYAVKINSYQTNCFDMLWRSTLINGIVLIRCEDKLLSMESFWYAVKINSH